MSQRSQTNLSVCLVVLCISACSSTLTPTPTTLAPAQHDFKGLVDVGHGRKIFAVCRGVGSPTVVLIAGKGNGAEDWMQILDPADPEHDAPGDNLPWGKGKLYRSDDAVFPSVARFARVIAYDRPDVRFDSDDVTTPRKQPHTLDLAVNDLHSLLTSLGEPGPFVLVAHSYGGLITTLYARTYPKNIAGLVMIDTVTEMIEAVISPGKLKNWEETNSTTSSQVREGVKIIDAFQRINAASPWPKVPAIVLSADKPWRLDLLPAEAREGERVSFADSLNSLERLASALGAEHFTKTQSGHDIYLYNPKLVTGAIRKVVEEVRQKN